MPTRPIAAWLAPLRGHVFDLEDLPLYLRGSPITVVARNSEYFLQIPASLAGDSHDRTRELAADYISLINGAASLHVAGHQSIALAEGGLIGIDSAGEVATTVLQVGCAESRCKAGQLRLLVNGVEAPDPREGAICHYLQAATKHSAKADALSILGRPSPSWSELYLVFELVEADVGSRWQAERWIEKAAAERFCRTANSYTALGRQARHGKNKNAPPAKPMAHGEAIALIRRLASTWISIMPT